jgi:hypothetical protein
MRMFELTMLFLALLCVSDSSYAQNNAEMLKSLLNTGKIAKVKVLRIADEVMTRIPITPERLRSKAEYEVVFKYAFESSFGSFLSEISAEESSRPADVRWGVLFYDASDKEVGSVFVDGFGDSGYLNGTECRFKAGLPTHLRRIIGGLH